MNEASRLTRIAQDAARRVGASVAVYANGESFDVLTERKRTLPDGSTVYDGLRWIRGKTRDAYVSPAAFARCIRREIKATWA
jgi:hypothetical protein